jgi:hypothetical protein
LLDAQFTRAGEYRIFKLAAQFCIGGRISPVAFGIFLLAERGDFQAIRAQLAIENEHVYFEPFPKRVGVFVPIGENSATEGIGSADRQER